MLALCAPSRAAADANDPPSRVARLADAEGSVSFQPGGTEDWIAAPVNRPLTTGDKLWSDQNSRVELQLDGSFLRLSSNTAISFLNLADDVTQVQLSAGTLLVRVRQLADNETYEIDTPNLAFTILRPGLYRLSVDESGNSTVVRVSSGQGEVTGGGAAYTVRANETDVFSGTDQLTEDTQSGGAGGDAFDAWSASRDGRSDRFRIRSLCFPGCHRLPGSGRSGLMEPDTRRGVCVVPAAGRSGLGAVPLWTLGLHCALGLHLGGRCAVGLCAVSLWPLGLLQRCLGLGAVSAATGG